MLRVPDWVGKTTHLPLPWGGIWSRPGHIRIVDLGLQMVAPGVQARCDATLRAACSPDVGIPPSSAFAGGPPSLPGESIMGGRACPRPRHHRSHAPVARLSDSRGAFVIAIHALVCYAETGRSSGYRLPATDALATTPHNGMMQRGCSGGCSPPPPSPDVGGPGCPTLQRYW